MKKIFGAVLVALVAVVFAACSGSNSTPTAAVEKYLSAMKSGDADGMVNVMHFKDESQKETVKNMISGKIEQSTKEKGGISSFEIKGEKIAEDGKTATVEYVLKYGDDSDESKSEKCVNVDGNWMIDTGK